MTRTAPTPAPSPAPAKPGPDPQLDLAAVNRQLAQAPASEVIQWAGRTFGQSLVMTSSFGAQSALMLHLVTRALPDIPVVLVDTGYLFPQTYRFAHQLAQRLGLNLKIYTPRLTPAHMEAVHGRLWEQGEAGMERYLQMMKVEPLQRAMEELGATAWLAGLRGGQTDHRAALKRVDRQDGRYKIHPVLSWTTRDVHQYLKKHDLPYHPMYDQGYASIGDVHSTLPITAGEDERAGRFHGLRQECGIHLPADPEEDQSWSSSGL